MLKKKKKSELRLIFSPKARSYSNGNKSTNAKALCSCLAIDFKCTGNWGSPSSHGGQKVPAEGFLIELVELKSQTHFPFLRAPSTLQLPSP